MRVCRNVTREVSREVKRGVRILGLLSRHGGTDAVLFYETMNYILWTQVPASLLQVEKSWQATD